MSRRCSRSRWCSCSESSSWQSRSGSSPRPSSADVRIVALRLRRRLLIAVLVALAVPASADAVSVQRGKSLRHRIFPANYFSVRDKRQLTGRRVHIRHRRCTAATYSICDGFAQLNKLDGFDLQPRVAVPFTGAIKLTSVSDRNFFIATPRGKLVSDLRQLPFDPKTHILAGLSDKFLAERKTYAIHVTRGIRDARGKRVKACRRSCVVKFTTRSASAELVHLRQAIDKQPV